MQHAEAFCLMTYKCEQCRKEEVLWNSRDGVTPFIIGCRYCGGEARHIKWNEDKFMPNYRPKKGQRIFIDVTTERKMEISRKRIDQFKGTPFEVPMENEGRVLKDIFLSFPVGTPDIKVI